MKDAVSFVKQFDYNGKLIREITPSGKGTAGGFGAKKRQRTLLYFYQLHYTWNHL